MASGIPVTITEPERKSLLQFARASPASRASFCYHAIVVNAIFQRTVLVVFQIVSRSKSKLARG